MRIRYPAMQNQEDEDIILGASRERFQVHDIVVVDGGIRMTRAANQQRLYPKHYYAGPGAVP